MESDFNVNYSQFCVDDPPLCCTNGSYHRRKSPFEITTTDSVAAIDHHVSKFDTLAGVAIKYGVEVADIKKMNGLVSDVQMFAHKSIQIPLPGRHPPSPAALSNASDSTPRNDDSADTYDSFHSFKLHTPNQRISPAMTSLQGYYGLDSVSTPLSTTSITSPRHHRKSRSLVDCLLEENNALADSRGNDSPEKLLRRRQKSEADFSKAYANIPIWDDSSGPSSCTITGKNLALRSKASNRADTTPIGTCESLETRGYSSVRKSSSTSNLHDQDSTTSLLWWSLKPDLHTISQATIARPIFDGLPKPITSRRNKAALD